MADLALTDFRPASLRGPWRFDELLSSAALALMMLIPIVEIALRPFLGRGVENGPVVVQHLGLVLAKFGAVAAERHGHLASLGGNLSAADKSGWRAAARAFADGSAALVCGLLAAASWRFVASEIPVSHVLAYGLPSG